MPALNLTMERLDELAKGDNDTFSRLIEARKEAQQAFAHFRVAWIVKSYNIAKPEETLPVWLLDQDLDVGVVRAISEIQYEHLLATAKMLTEKGKSKFRWVCREITIALNEELARHGYTEQMQAYRVEGSKRVKFRLTTAL